MTDIKIIRQDPQETPYAKPIKRAVLRCASLSYGARGLVVLIWDYPQEWVFNLNQLVKMSPGGITQLKGYIRELKEAGAIQILPNRLTADDAEKLNKKLGKKYRQGQILGRTWVLNHPDNWAVEYSLKGEPLLNDAKTPKSRFSNSRLKQQSVKATDGKSEPKVLNKEGSPIEELQTDNVDLDNQVNSHQLIFPKQLTSDDILTAKLKLRVLDSHVAQQVLDELAGRLDEKKVNGSPQRYLQALIKAAKAGQFQPQAGVHVSRLRNSSARDEETLNQVKQTSKENAPEKIEAMYRSLNMSKKRKK